MINKLKNLVEKKIFHICVIVTIIVILLFILGFVILKYNVEGEKNMPFGLSKISIISTSEGVDKPAEESRWAFDVYQSNDIYIYIDKNKEYEKTELIKSVVVDNIQIESKNNENVKIYKPDLNEEKLIFKNKDENIISSLEYVGSDESDLKNLRISNQGGIVAFRCSNNNLAEYKSNEEEINHHYLLKKANISEEKIKIKLSFDFILKLESGKEYKTNVELQLPVGNVIEEGTTSQEITDLSNCIFKRIKNK